MGWLSTNLLTGITAFVATNIDDLVILVLFFTQVNAVFRPKYVVLGQYLGFTVLLLVSLPGFFGGLVIPKAWIGLLGLLPIAIGLNELICPKDEAAEVQTVADNPSVLSNPAVGALISLLNPMVYKVAAVTVANGGDNIGIYLPLFASLTLASLGVILGVFFVLMGVWCYVAHELTRHPAIAPLLTRYGKAIVPFVLIGLGLFILIENGTFHWVL